MSTLLKKNRALQKENKAKGFNMVSEQIPAPIVFDPQPLCPEETSDIKNLLLESEGIGKIKLDQIEKDSIFLAQLTSELRGIGKQGVFLMGARVIKAREVLKSYKDGTFTHWLTKTFGTRKTGYNALSYYELCQSLPDKDIREKFMKIPLSAAYTLASRDGKLKKKISLINRYYGKKQRDIISEIKKEFPTEKKGGRKEKISIDSMINIIFTSIEKIEERKNLLSSKNRKTLKLIEKAVKGLLD